MFDFWAATLGVVTRRLTGPTGLAVGILLLSIILSAGIVFIQSDEPRTPKGMLSFFFPLEILTHPSAKADFSFWISRRFVMLLVALPTGASITIACGYACHAILIAAFGSAGHTTEAPAVTTLILFTFSMLLAYDISYYLYHNLQHRIPVLWELHKVHHSAEVMVGTTKDRVHPLDDIMNRVWDALITGPVYGFWLFFAFNPVELTVLGINVYVLRNIIMMDFVRHTHLKVSFGKIINGIILCPHYHQLHHSSNPIHFDKNFGLMLSVWDRIFGTLHVPAPNESFAFGLGHEGQEYQSTAGLYVLPLRKIARLMRFGHISEASHAVSATPVDASRLRNNAHQQDRLA